jgi:hypothetical protein
MAGILRRYVPMGQYMNAIRSKKLALLTLVAVCCGLLPVGTTSAAEETETGGTSELTGTVTGPDEKPLVGVSVLAYHLSSEAVFTSEPTAANGNYRIVALPYGYYDMAVQTPDGLFVANQVVNVPPKGNTVASFALSGIDLAADPNASPPRSFPGIDADPTGVASVNEKLAGREFWRSKKGVAIIAGGGAAALLLIASGGSSSSSSNPSPSTP